MKNQIFNENNLDTLERMDNASIDGIITSPPYNISSTRKDMYYNTGYTDIDGLPSEYYLDVRLNEFKEFERVLTEDGVICYNLSYIHENPMLPYQLVNRVHSETDLTLADVVYWKKSNAIPFQTSPTKLSRIVEPVYIFVRKSRLANFKTNKQVSKINPKTNQKFYKNYTNIVEAKNNDGIKTSLKAVYSTDLVKELIRIYFPEGSTIYDPFMGIGTTARGCKIMNCNYIGSELKEEYYNLSINLLEQKNTIQNELS